MEKNIERITKTLTNGTEIINSYIDPKSNVYKNTKITDSYLGPKSTVGDLSVVYKSTLKENVSLNRNCYIVSTEIDFATYLNRSVIIKDTCIGKFCAIGWGASMGGKKHKYDSASTYSNYWFKKNLGIEEELVDEVFPVGKIGDDSWICSNANILRGVNVGIGGVCAAGSVVTKDVDPYTIVAGVPAKPVKKRFDDYTISALLEIKWWDWPVDIIRENVKALKEDLTPEILKRFEKISSNL